MLCKFLLYKIRLNLWDLEGYFSSDKPYLKFDNDTKQSYSSKFLLYKIKLNLWDFEGYFSSDKPYLKFDNATKQKYSSKWIHRKIMYQNAVHYDTDSFFHNDENRHHINHPWDWNIVNFCKLQTWHIFCNSSTACNNWTCYETQLHLGLGLQSLYIATNCADNILGCFTTILQIKLQD